jgi:hypothetical protein
MRPVTFYCSEIIPRVPAEIAGSILQLERWPDFPGYGPIPAILSAEFETRREDVVGTRIRVNNRDGSGHTEEILAWDPSSRVVLRMNEFGPPLNRIATHFQEEWRLVPVGEETRVERRFSLYGRSWAGRWALLPIAVLLRRAVVRHLIIMKVEAERLRWHNRLLHQ